MEIGESSSNFGNDKSDVSGDKNLSKKSFDELSKIVVGLIEINKNRELKNHVLEKVARDERSLEST